MAKNSVLNRPQVEIHSGRSAKDLSANQCWNQSAGMIIPVLCKYVPKGTKGVLNRVVFTRTKSPQFPAFEQVTQHIDFFKIPLRYLYSAFNDWSLNINDLNSSLLLGHVTGQGNENKLPVQLPSAEFKDILDKICPQFAAQSQSEINNLTCNWYNNALRLIDHLEYGRECISTASNVMSLLKLAAYQKVYYDHYRNTSYESNNAYHYNLDWMMDSPIADLTDSTTTTRLSGLFELRYVNYRNDFFHNLYPSLNYSLNVTNVSDWDLPSSVQGLGNSTSFAAVRPQNGGLSIPQLVQSTNDTTSAGYTRISVQSMRAAFALDKLLRASAYAPKHVREQFKARFGVDPGNKVSMESERLGSFINDVQFGEVTCTSVGSVQNYSQLGDIGGKGIGSGKPEKDLHFFAEEDSIIMAVQYFMPRGYYDSFGVDEFNTYLTKEDFPQPEYMNLGLRPMFAKYLNNGLSVTDRNVIIGFTVPYQGLKLGIDKNFGLFNSHTLIFTPASGQSSTPSTQNVAHQLSCFTTHQTRLLAYTTAAQISTGMTWQRLKVIPNDLDTLFKEAYSVSGDEGTDQFYGWLRIKFAIVNWLSIHGQPSL